MCVYVRVLILFSGGRFVVTSQGDLHIRAARPEDGRATYSCLTLHALTSERRKSEPATLTVTGNRQNRINLLRDINIKSRSGLKFNLLPRIPLYNRVAGKAIIPCRSRSSVLNLSPFYL